MIYIPCLPVAFGIAVGVAVAAFSCMCRASVAHENGLLLHDMIPLSEGGAWVHRMLVIETAAYRVAFNDLVAHDERGATPSIDVDRLSRDYYGGSENCWL